MAKAIEARRPSLEGLLHEIYDRPLPAHCGLETDTWTDTSASNFSDHFSSSTAWRQSASALRSIFARRSRAGSAPSFSLTSSASVDDDVGAVPKFDKLTLFAMDAFQLSQLSTQLRAAVASTSLLLIKHLKRRDHQLSRMRARCNIMTAILQAVSPKRSVDAKLQFTLEPPVGENGYEQWLNGMKSVARLPDGMPPHFRKRLWLTLADHYVKTANVDWEATRKRAFNDRMNDDDDELSLQIVKDLHRTGWSGLNGDMERVLLKRVLLAYARYNKAIGYCQGFNVIAALILEVMEYNEETALKVMIMLIENVLPSGYFDQTLRALSVDMAVLRDLVYQRLPRLSAHLDHLQLSSESEFEPPLTNVFSMQWFLTLFATCLPKQAVFRIWDSLMLEGSEILLRAALAIWAKMGRRIYRATTADSYYTMMGVICQELLHMNNDQCNDLMQVVYSMAEFPYPGLSELRDRYTWNIQPFSSAFRLLRQQVVSILKSDDESGSDLVSISPKHSASGGRAFLTPPGHGSSRASSSATSGSASDLSKLEKQYKLIRQRQKQAAIILQNALTHSADGHSSSRRRPLIPPANAAAASSLTTEANGDGDIFNHLYLNRGSSQTITTSALNGTVSVASRVVQPSGQVAPRSSKPPPKSCHSSKHPFKVSLRRLRSDDSSASADAVPARSLGSPPSSPISIGTGSISTPTSSGGGSTPGVWTPTTFPKSSSWCRRSESEPGNDRRRRYSVGDFSDAERKGRRNRRRWHSCCELSSVKAFTKKRNGRQQPKSQIPMNGAASRRHPTPPPVPARPTTSPAPPRPSERKKQYTRPPPLDLRMLSNGNGPKTPPTASGRAASSSSTSTACTFTTTPNGAASASSTHATMLKKSKAILASISSAEESENGENRRSGSAMRNPFPVKRQTALIERGKRLGLYS